MLQTSIHILDIILASFVSPIEIVVQGLRHYCEHRSNHGQGDGVRQLRCLRILPAVNTRLLHVFVYLMGQSVLTLIGASIVIGKQLQGWQQIGQGSKQSKNPVHNDWNVGAVVFLATARNLDRIFWCSSIVDAHLRKVSDTILV